jgi:hypothetical protein
MFVQIIVFLLFEPASAREQLSLLSSYRIVFDTCCFYFQGRTVPASVPASVPSQSASITPAKLFLYFKFESLIHWKHAGITISEYLEVLKSQIFRSAAPRPCSEALQRCTILRLFAPLLRSIDATLRLALSLRSTKTVSSLRLGFATQK